MHFHYTAVTSSFSSVYDVSKPFPFCNSQRNQIEPYFGGRNCANKYLVISVGVSLLTLISAGIEFVSNVLYSSILWSGPIIIIFFLIIQPSCNFDWNRKYLEGEFYLFRRKMKMIIHVYDLYLISFTSIGTIQVEN